MYKDKDADKEYKRKWREKNKEKIRETQRKLHQTPEWKAYQREWRKKNKDILNAKLREYRAKHPEQRAAETKKYRSRPEVKERLRLEKKIRWAKIRKTVLTAYGGKCVCCGESKIEFLAIDHINGGGSQHRKELGTINIYPWLIKQNFPEGFRVLCHNCNISLGYYGYCPHGDLTQTLLNPIGSRGRLNKYSQDK